MGEVSFTIRSGKAGDGEALASIFCAAIMQSAASHYTPEQRWAWSSGLTAATFESRIGLLEFRIAETEAGEPVGFAALNPMTTELDYLYVHPAMSGRGVATMLFNNLLDRARELGLKSMYVIGSLNAAAFYKAVGFIETERLVRTRENIDLPCLRMERPI